MAAEKFPIVVLKSLFNDEKDSCTTFKESGRFLLGLVF